MATKVDPAAPKSIQKVMGMTSFFQNRLASTPKKPVASVPPVQGSLAAPPDVAAEMAPTVAEKEKIC